MKVKVSDIREKGLELDEPLKLDFLKEAFGGTGFEPARPSSLHASFQKLSSGVLLKGRFQVDATAPCKRCLAPVTLSLPSQFMLELVPEKLARAEEFGNDEGDDDERGERGGTFNLEDADREVFDGEQIDLDPIVREQVLLALPMDAVCSEDCKGLCAQCGQNLNEKACGCETKRVDPRLAPLANIKLKPQA